MDIPHNRYAFLKNRHDIQRLLKKNQTAVGRSQLLAAMQDWYMELDNTDREVADELISMLMDGQRIRSGEGQFRFGAMGALELLGAIIAVEMGWRHERSDSYCPICGAKLDEDLAPCGHPNRFWKVEVNDDAWCLLCYIEEQEAALKWQRQAHEASDGRSLDG